MGARVTNISYDTKTDYLIHFSDHKGKPSLQQGIRNIPLEESSGSRNLGDAMRFVARHMFKHARLGLVRRKVAVFSWRAGPVMQKPSARIHWGSMCWTSPPWLSASPRSTTSQRPC